MRPDALIGPAKRLLPPVMLTVPLTVRLVAVVAPAVSVPLTVSVLPDGTVRPLLAVMRPAAVSAPVLTAAAAESPPLALSAPRAVSLVVLRPPFAVSRPVAVAVLFAVSAPQTVSG